MCVFPLRCVVSACESLDVELDCRLVGTNGGGGERGHTLRDNPRAHGQTRHTNRTDHALDHLDAVFTVLTRCAGFVSYGSQDDLYSTDPNHLTHVLLIYDANHTAPTREHDLLDVAPC